MHWRNFSFGLSGLLLGTLLSGAALAQDLQVSVKLSQIERVRAQEKSGDELYFSVTEYPSKGRPHNDVVPEYPLHWLSDHLKELKDVVLWEKLVKEGEGSSVILSLIEQDAPPWDMDELIGTVKLNLKNEKGKLKKEWTIPNRADTEPVKAHENEFLLMGSGAEYHVVLKVKYAIVKAEKANKADKNNKKLKKAKASSETVKKPPHL